jgi:hypothetical protein
MLGLSAKQVQRQLHESITFAHTESLNLGIEE